MSAKSLGPWLSVSLQAVGLALGLLVNAALARVLGVADYGAYALAYNAVSLLAVPLEVGLAMVVVREVSQALEKADWSAMLGMIRGALRLTLGLALGLGGAFWLIVHWTLAASPAVHDLLPWAGLMLFLSGLTAVRGSLLRALGHPLQAQALMSLIRPLVLLGGLLTLSLIGWPSTGQGVTAEDAMRLQCLALASCLLFAIAALHRRRPAALRGVRPAYRWRQWARDIPGFSLMALAFAANQTLGGFLLGGLQGVDQVGLYRVAELAASLVVTPLGTLAVYYSADVSRRLADNDLAGVQLLLRRGARIALACALPLAAACLLGGGWLLGSLFGEGYAAAALPMTILVLAQVLNTLAGLTGCVMSMAGLHRPALQAVLMALLLQGLFALLLVPHWSATGAALASALATVFWSQRLRREVWHRFGLRTGAMG